MTRPGQPESVADGGLRDCLIICLASSWQLDPTSKHHIMRILSRTNDVVWVNYHGSRRPKMNRHDAGWIVSALKRVVAGASRINARMVQMTPMLIPGGGRICAILNRLMLTVQIRRVASRFGSMKGRNVLLWSFAPDADFLVGALNESCVIYYCVDDFARFDGFDAKRIAAAEQRLIQSANLVITSSSALYEQKSRMHDNVHLVRHGVNFEHFHRAVTDALPLPEPLQHIKRPLAGFVGLVHHWFDHRLFDQLAARCPDVSFVVVGECKPDSPFPRAAPNVHLLGRQPYDDLPAYMAHFDVGLIPFLRNDLTGAVNPIKLREYLSAGLAVVSTDLPEVRAVADRNCAVGDVYLADDACEFAAACRDAISSKCAQSSRARSLRMKDQDWEHVTAHISNLVSDAMNSAASHGAGRETLTDPSPASTF